MERPTPGAGVVCAGVRLGSEQLYRRLRGSEGKSPADKTAVVAFVGCERLLTEDFGPDSLYRVMETGYDVPLVEAEREVEAVQVGTEEAPLLQVAVGAPVPPTRRLTYTDGRDLVKDATSTYRGDKHTFHACPVRGTRRRREASGIGHQASDECRMGPRTDPHASPLQCRTRRPVPVEDPE